LAKKSKKKSARELSIDASYDSASTYRENEYRFEHADHKDANEANSLAVRKALRSRSRYIYDNCSYAFGLVDTVAKDTIGTGPRLQMTTDSDLHKELERDHKSWMKEVRYAKKLRLSRTCKARDGEGYILKTRNEKLKNIVKLFPQVVETDLISSKSGAKTDVDGVYLDKFGEAKAYWMLENKPSDQFTSIRERGRRIDADKIIQYAHITRAGQVRGVPETTPALQLFVQLAGYTLTTLSAAETAASFSAVMQTDSSAEEEAVEFDNDFMKFKIERNTMTNLPNGWKLSQFKPEQPVANFSEFRDAILNEAAQCMHVPFNVASGNSSDYNYASGRLDIVNYHKALAIERSDIDIIINDNLFDDYTTEWMARKGLTDSTFDLSHIWMYDGHEPVDAKKNADAQTVQLENGTTNLATECAKVGSDWEEVMEQGVLEQKKLQELQKKHGIVVPIEGEDSNVKKEDKNEE